jgi:hypothetical protein
MLAGWTTGERRMERGASGVRRFPGVFPAMVLSLLCAAGDVLATPDSTRAEGAAASPDSTADRTPAVPQRDAMDILGQLLGRPVTTELEVETRVGISWALLPTLSYNPVYGWALGASATGVGRTGTGPHSRPAYLSLAGNYSTTEQVQALARGEISTPSGTTMLQADFRYLDTDRSTWGLGPISEDQEEYPMKFRLYRAYATVYRRTAGPVYVGIGYHYDLYDDIRDVRAEEGESTPFLEYSGPGVTSTQASGVSLNLLADTRDNLGNPFDGYYLRGSFRSYQKTLGSDENWQEFWVSMRLYPALPEGSQRILAFWLYGWFTFGQAPYLDLPASGWDKYGRGARGYLQGRIRAPNQIYLETEYRFPLTRDGLLGAVAFVNATGSTDFETGVFSHLDPGGGVGLRIKLNKESRSNIAVDRAWGRFGSGGWFLGLSEVF